MAVCAECYKIVQSNNKAARKKKAKLYNFNYGTLIDSVQAGEIDRLYKEMETQERIEREKTRAVNVLLAGPPPRRVSKQRRPQIAT